jgi:hypothetical protein
MKLCKACNQTKNLDQFYARRGRKNSVQHSCKECSKAEKRIWQRTNSSKVNANSTKWQKANSEYYKNYKSANHKQRYNNDIQYRIKHNLRTRLNSAVKNNSKTGSAIKDLGCSIEQLKAHLESQFLSGMNWDNYGEWHIDHIDAISKFDLINTEELKKACHYSNLQPMWAKDNLSKGDK